MEVMSIFERSLPKEAHVLYLEAPFPDGEGFCWFDYKNLDREKTENQKLESEKKIIASLEELLQNAKDEVTPRAIVGIGFSQGAFMLGRLIQKYPRFDGIALLAGLTELVSETVPSESSPRLLFANGTKDEIFSILSVNEVALKFRERGYSVTMVTDDVGHKIGPNGFRELKSWSQMF
jgi:predicted esterase